MLYKNLLKTIEQRKALEKKIAIEKEKFEFNIAAERALLEDLETTEEQQRKELLVFMKEKNIANEKINNHLITRNIKTTNQIKDINQFATAVAKHKINIIELGITQKQLNDLFKDEKIITNKKLAVDIVNNLEKVDNILLNGCEKKITEFLTVT